MVNEENVGGVHNDESQNVMQEEQTTQIEQTQTQEVNQEEPVQEPKIDPDEKILSDMFDSGKTEVTTGELVSSGIDTSRMAQYAFEIGKFKLTRLLLVSPYKIEKTQ